MKKAREIMKKATEILDQRIKLAVLGPTKAGESFLLRELTFMKGCFLSGFERGTTNFCKFKVSTEPMKNPIIFTEISADDTKIDKFNTI